MKAKGQATPITATRKRSLPPKVVDRIAVRRFRAAVGAVSTGAFLLLAACVPSPTATPPLATAFPTLVLPTDTPPPTATVFGAPTGAPALPSPTLTATAIAPIAQSSPAATPVRGVQPPLIQVTAFPATGPVSVDQPVELGVIAAGRAGIGRLELYDENVLYSSTPSPDPPPLTVSTILTWKSERLGMHHLRVVAYDPAGRMGEPAQLQFVVLNDNRAPMATITVPIGEIDLPVGSPFVLQGVATDEVAVERVDLYVDNQLYTFVESNKQAGESPLAVSLMWVPTSVGVHQIFLRAHDNAGGTGDSAPLLANVVDSQAPAVVANYESDQIGANGTLLVHAFALSPNHIVRMELWADNEIVQLVESAAADAQTTLDAQLIWEGGGIGDHTLFVRAYDRSGLNASTGPQIIHVREESTLAPTTAATTSPATATAAPVLPSPTPQVVLPAPPTVQLTTAEDRGGALLPGPVHIRLTAHASVELDHVELWGYFQGEANPQLLLSDGAKGATDKTVDFAWSPPGAGVALLFARVVDQVGQTGQSAVTAISLLSPAAPTPTPAFFSLVGHWTAEIPTSKFAVDLLQYGSALRGTFANTPVNGTPYNGTVVAGSVARDRVVFSVVFDSPDAVPHSLDFQCLPSAGPPQLACNYQDEAGNRGSAVFAPSP